MGRAFLEVYHRYMLYMHLISIRQNTNYDQQYYSQYIRGGCFQACPENSYCNRAFCEQSDQGQQEKYYVHVSQMPCNPNDIESIRRCQSKDINMICLNHTCSCRPGLKWDYVTRACQFY